MKKLSGIKTSTSNNGIKHKLSRIRPILIAETAVTRTISYKNISVATATPKGDRITNISDYSTTRVCLQTLSFDTGSTIGIHLKIYNKSTNSMVHRLKLRKVNVNVANKLNLRGSFHTRKIDSVFMAQSCGSSPY